MEMELNSLIDKIKKEGVEQAEKDAGNIKKEARERAREIVEEAEKTKPTEEAQARGPLPNGNFAAMLSMLMTQALFSLGLLQVKGQEQREPDLELAKYNIDMLETLQEKTKGNLTEAEEKALEDTLNDLRMAYVKIAG